MMRGLLVATGFLTRVPVPVRVFDDERAKAQSLAWYPLVGLLMGVGLAGLAWCLAVRRRCCRRPWSCSPGLRSPARCIWTGLPIARMPGSWSG